MAHKFMSNVRESSGPRLDREGNLDVTVKEDKSLPQR